MKTYIKFLLLLLLPLYSMGQNPDCVIAITICEGSVIDYVPVGPGSMDVFTTDCYAAEDDPAWFYFEFDDTTPEGSLLEFTIIADVGLDYDFNLFGPNNDGNPMDCASLGHTVSCNHALTLDGLTGMSDTETGPDWEPALPVSPGDGFWLSVDNIDTEFAGFSIEWGPETAPYLDCDAIPNCEMVLVLDESMMFCPEMNIDLVAIVTEEVGTLSFEWTSDPASAIDYLSNTAIVDPIFNAPLGEFGPFTYTITVTDDLCTRTRTIELISYDNIEPTFDIVFEFCESDPILTLPGTSDNGYTGLWSPSVFDPSGGSTVLTFVLDSGQDNCFVSLDVIPIVELLEEPLFSFSISYCEFDVDYSLPTVSDNGITGVWEPAMIEPLSMGGGLFDIIFTPEADLCASNDTIEIEIISGVIAEFAEFEDLCSSDAILVLPTTSSNGIEGMWDIPSIDPSTATSMTIVTFTPNIVLYPCQETYNTTINTLSDIAPSFDFDLEICDTDMAINLPIISDEGYTGVWDIPIIDPTGQGGTQITTTFTPDANQADCLTPVEYTFTIEETIIPVFDLPDLLCELDVVYTFPDISANGISGVWNPLMIDPNNQGGTMVNAVFTPVTGFCYESITQTIDILDALSVSFDLDTVLCELGAILFFPSTSIAGITGSWTLDEINPLGMGGESIINTFVADAGPDECFEIYEIEISIVSSITPYFIGIEICENDAPVILPVISDNGLEGTWNPAIVDPYGLGGTTIEIVFTPENNDCAIILTMDLDIDNPIVPEFSIDTSLCAMGEILNLPLVDDNGIVGSWTPSVIDPGAGGSTEVAIFTPDPSFCADPLTVAFIIVEGDTSVFAIQMEFCETEGNYDLPNNSENGIIGTWDINPIVPPTLGAGTHTLVFTPEDECNSIFMETIIIVSEDVADFELLNVLCINGDIYDLPLVSDNGYSGTWNIPEIDPETLGIGVVNLVFSLEEECSEDYETTIEIINIPIFEDLVFVPPTNCGVEDGSITIEASGNNLSYSIDGGITWFIDSLFSNLGGGVYDVMVTNGDCDITESVSLTSPGAPSVDSIELQALTDCTIFDGIIEVFATGSELEYSIDGGINFFDENVFNDLESGSYTVIVRSKNAPDCTTTQIVVLDDVIETTILDVQVESMTDCESMDGQIMINATGASIEYSIDSGMTWQENSSFSNLDTGYYISLVQSQTYTSCVDELDLIISGPILPQISNAVGQNPSFCNGSDGQITIIDHQLGIEYSIDNGLSWQEDSVFINLVAEDYNILYRLVNAINCNNLLSISLVDPDIPQIIEVMVSPDSLCLSAVGSIFLVSDSTNYEYSIDNGLNWQSNPLFENLEMGDYNIQVRSVTAPSCVIFVDITVDGLTLPSIDSILIEEISDCGLSDGGVLIVSEGNVEYSIDGGISWNETGIFNNLDSGVYEILLRIIGINDCTSTSTFELIDPDCDCLDLVIIDTTANISCYSYANGYAELLSIEGAEDPIISWSNGETGSYISDLNSGWYTYSIQYDANCEWSDSIKVQEPDEMYFSLESTPTDCPEIDNGTIIISEIEGGMGEILFAINDEEFQNSPVFSNLPPDEYQIFIKDENDCVSDNHIIVDEGEGLSLNFEPISTINAGDSIYLKPMLDESMIDSFYWSPNDRILNPGVFIALTAPLHTTDYTLTIFYGICIEEQTITVEVIDEIVIYVPSVFRPGSTNGNNYFYISTGSNFSGEIEHISIYNRWGGQLFSVDHPMTNIPEEGWDGMSKGNYVDSGVYVYTIKYTINGTSKYKLGDITIVR